MFENYWAFLKEVFAEDPKMISHTEAVFQFAEAIAEDLGIVGPKRRIIELSALLPDVGIVEAFKKYGSREGQYQHIEGPPLARKIMEREGETPEVIERVTFIVGHHHDFSCVDDLDFQVLIEADMLVNLEELGMGKRELAAFIDAFFKTSRGKALAQTIYL